MASAEQMIITRNGARPTIKGPSANFTGTVMVTPLFEPNASMNTSGASVHFEPGARSAWHTHPAGQMMIVTTGVGWIQEWNGAKREIKPGDVIWTPAGVKHWHGGTPSTSLTHTVLQDVVAGQNVEWLEQVTDTQYQSPVERAEGVQK